MHQVLGAEISMVLYYQRNEGLRRILHGVFQECKVFIGYVNGTSTIQKVPQTRPFKLLTAQAMPLLSAFEIQLYFHATMF